MIEVLNPIFTAKQVTDIVHSPESDRNFLAATVGENGVPEYLCSKMHRFLSDSFAVAVGHRFYFNPFPTEFMDSNMPRLKA